MKNSMNTMIEVGRKYNKWKTLNVKLKQVENY